jgi:zinc/manganese transport system substrate-binding protein
MRVRRKIEITLAAVIVLVAATTLSACGEGESEDGDGLTVVATIPQVGDLVSNVGGDRVRVSQIVAAGSDPHGFEPRPSDVAATAEAVLIFRSGSDIDPWADHLATDSGSDAEVVDLSNALDDTGGEDLDPHWWHDPRNAIAAVELIAERLTAVDSADEAIFEENAARLGSQIERLDRQIADCLGGIDRAQRKLVTDHEAFGHFARRYGLEIIGTVIPARTSEAQPSARDMSRLSEAIEEHGVAAVFPETSLSPKLAEAIAAQTGAEVADPLWGDTLAPPGEEGSTYLGMMAANARAIAAGLSGGQVRCEIDVDE